MLRSLLVGLLWLNISVGAAGALELKLQRRTDGLSGDEISRNKLAAERKMEWFGRRSLASLVTGNRFVRSPGGTEYGYTPEAANDYQPAHIVDQLNRDRRSNHLSTAGLGGVNPYPLVARVPADDNFGLDADAGDIGYGDVQYGDGSITPPSGASTRRLIDAEYSELWWVYRWYVVYEAILVNLVGFSTLFFQCQLQGIEAHVYKKWIPKFLKHGVI